MMKVFCLFFLIPYICARGEEDKMSQHDGVESQHDGGKSQHDGGKSQHDGVESRLNDYQRKIINKEAAENYFIMTDKETKHNPRFVRIKATESTSVASTYTYFLTLLWVVFGILIGQVIRDAFSQYRDQKKQAAAQLVTHIQKKSSCK